MKTKFGPRENIERCLESLRHTLDYEDRTKLWKQILEILYQFPQLERSFQKKRSELRPDKCEIIEKIRIEYGFIRANSPFDRERLEEKILAIATKTYFIEYEEKLMDEFTECSHTLQDKGLLDLSTRIEIDMDGFSTDTRDYHK